MINGQHTYFSRYRIMPYGCHNRQAISVRVPANTLQCFLNILYWGKTYFPTHAWKIQNKTDIMSVFTSSHIYLWHCEKSFCLLFVSAWKCHSLTHIGCFWFFCYRCNSICLTSRLGINATGSFTCRLWQQTKTQLQNSTLTKAVSSVVIVWFRWRIHH